MDEKGSTAGFVLAVIGGILGIIVGLNILLKAFVNFWAIQIIQTITTSQKIVLVIYIVVAFYFITLSVWVLYSAAWMRKRNSLKKGAMTALICGILSLDIFASIGGIVGILANKNKMLETNEVIVK